MHFGLANSILGLMKTGKILEKSRIILVKTGIVLTKNSPVIGKIYFGIIRNILAA
jgi:hypothetical protein